jgi:hypothetical protein
MMARYRSLLVGTAVVILGTSEAVAYALRDQMGLAAVYGLVVGLGVAMLARAVDAAYSAGRGREHREWISRLEAIRPPLANGHDTSHDVAARHLR